MLHERGKRFLALMSVLAASCCFGTACNTTPHLVPASLNNQTFPFADIAAKAGLTFKYENGRQGMASMMEEAGSGCALLDYDGDGLLDLYLVNGRDLYTNKSGVRNALYHNNGDGTFTDVTEKAGVPGTGYGFGVSIADYDNDGHADIFITQWGKNCLYRNNGNGTFTDVTEKAKLGGMDFGEPFHTGACWLDYDHDGKLDLYVSTYVKFRRDGLKYCKLAPGITSNCPPNNYYGTPSQLFHNNGDGTFSNVTKKAGVYMPNGKGLSAIACDYDDDGWTDILMGNDGTENWLWRNNHDGTFTNTAYAMNVATSHSGDSIASMGMDFGDFMNEGRPGLFIADWSKRPDHLWRQDKGGFYSDISAPSGIGDAGFQLLGFGAQFLDYDNDGWLDLIMTNGHVYPEVDAAGTGETYLQVSQLFHNETNAIFKETTKQSGPAFQIAHAGRGLAVGDIDNDGKLDVLINNNDGAPLLLRNTSKNENHFINLKLVGVKSNRDAIGSRVSLKAGRLNLLRDVKSGGSYLSSSDMRLCFGVGTSKMIDGIEVRWTNGLKQKFGPMKADGFYRLTEGTKEPERIQ